MKTVNILFIAFLTLIMTACSTGKGTLEKNAQISELEGVWNLQDEGETSLGIGNNPITLILDPTAPNGIFGFSGCNNYGANVSGYNGNITFSKIYSTEMACPNLDLEKNYLNLLEQVNRFEISRKELYLYKNKLLLLHYKR